MIKFWLLNRNTVLIITCIQQILNFCGWLLFIWDLPSLQWKHPQSDERLFFCGQLWMLLQSKLLNRWIKKRERCPKKKKVRRRRGWEFLLLVASGLFLLFSYFKKNVKKKNVICSCKYLHWSTWLWWTLLDGLWCMFLAAQKCWLHVWAAVNVDYGFLGWMS